jgi:hypothetical protein
MSAAAMATRDLYLVVGYDGPLPPRKLGARGDVKLAEHFPRVIFDGAGARP